MTDVAAIINRLTRTYLYPPDARPAQAHLATAINATATSVVFKNFVLPEDEELMKVGAQFEINSELFDTVGYDENTTTATVLRASGGTTAASHSVDDPIIISPPYTRLSIFEAVGDNILTLYPKLYTVTTTAVSTVAPGIAALDDALAAEIIEVWPDGFHSAVDLDAKIVDYHPAAGGRAVVLNLQDVSNVFVRYRRRMGDATAETDTMADLGVENRWVNIVMAGAAADIFAGRDLSASHVDWVGAALQTENIPVGTRMNLAQQLAAYREYLFDKAQAEMQAEYRAKIHMRNPTRVVVRDWMG